MSKKLIVSILIIGMIIALSIWAFVVSSNITKSVEKASIEPDKRSENINAENLIITETKSGQKYWEVCAKSGNYDNKNTTVVLKNVKGNLYKDNNITLSFDAPIGIYSEKTKEIRLKGGSRALTDKDIFVSADQLTFFGKKDLFFADGNVKIRQTGKLLTFSDQSVFNSDFTDLKIIGNAKTLVYE